jgi:ketosteroid isomerase-like protein
MEYNDWLERYRRAWIDRDAEAAAVLFTEDAIYREQPFQPPFVGREAIRQYWFTVTRTQGAVDLQYGTPVVDGRRVAVEWWATLLNDGKPLTLAGEFLLLFADDGRCRELREYWAVTESTMTPPHGWGS